MEPGSQRRLLRFRDGRGRTLAVSLRSRQKLSAMSSQQVQKREIYDSPVSCIRRNSGSEGLGWFDLDCIGRKRKRSEEDRVASVSKVPTKSSFLHQAILTPLDHIVEDFRKADEIILTRKELEKVESISIDELEAKNSSLLGKRKGNALEKQIQRIKEIIARKAEARRIEFKYMERMKNRFQMDHADKIKHEYYHLPRMIHLKTAKSIGERAQLSAVRSVWPAIKLGFDFGGGILPVSRLRALLIGLRITPPHAGRLILNCCSRLSPGEHFIKFEDLKQICFAREGDAPKTGCSSLRDLLSKRGDVKAFLDGFCGENSTVTALDEFKLLQFQVKNAIDARTPSPQPRKTNSVLNGLGTSLRHLKTLEVKLRSQKKDQRRTSSQQSQSLSPISEQHQFVEELVEKLRHSAATKITACARGVLDREKCTSLRHERLIGRQFNRRVQKKMGEWFKRARRGQTVRIHARRFFHIWKRYMKLLRQKREFFRIAFWPFHTWRGNVFSNRNTIRKVRFLKRIWHTLVVLRNFRAWKELTVAHGSIRAKARQKFQKVLTNSQRLLFESWRDIVANEKRLNVIWSSRGQRLRDKLQGRLVGVAFYAWKLVCFVQKEHKAHVRSCFNMVGEKYALKHKIRREELAMRPREYQIVRSPIDRLHFQPFLRAVGTNGERLLRKDIWIKDKLVSFYSNARNEARLARISFAIERNRLMPHFFNLWCDFVEIRQKERYAWFHFTETLLKVVFDQWCIAVPGQRERRKRTRHSHLFLEEVGVETKEESDTSEGKPSRWIMDNHWMKESMKTVTSITEEVQSSRFKTKLQLMHHRSRMNLAVENRDLSEEHANMLLAQRKKELDEQKKEQLSKAEELYAKRGVVMHDALCSIIDQVERSNMQQMIQLCFRMLRFPVIQKKSHNLFQRRRLQNWVRLAVRYRQLWNSMPRYRRLRTKMIVFNAWMRFIADQSSFETPGLRKHLLRRQEIMLKYSKLLPHSLQNLEETRTSTAMYFGRWAEHSQAKHTRRSMVQLARHHQKMKVKWRVFLGWKTGIIRHKNIATQEPFLVTRATFDLQKWKSRMLVFGARMESTKMRARIREMRKRLKGRVVKKTQVLKLAIENHIDLSVRRIQLEARLLCSAFEDRASFQFRDELSHLAGMPQDVAAGSNAFKDECKLSSSSVHSVLVCVSDGMVVGVQIRYQSGPDSAPKIWLGRAHGRISELDTIFEFNLKDPEERLVVVEGFARDDIVGGKLRFRTNRGRVSPWYGQGVAGRKFRLEAIASKATEVDAFIVGFHGFSTTSGLISLGIVVRKVEKKNMFSRCWLDRKWLDPTINDVVVLKQHKRVLEEQDRLHAAQFRNVLQMRMSELYALLARSVSLAKRMRYGRGIPDALSSVCVSAGMMRWLFNALSNRLIKLSVQVHRRATALLNDVQLIEGHNLIKEGTTSLMLHLDRLAKKEVEFGKQKTKDGFFTAAEIGQEVFDKMMQGVRFEHEQVEEARGTVAKGRRHVARSLATIPGMSLDEKTVAHFSDLVQLSILRHQLG